MREKVKTNLAKALADVSASITGTLGIVLVIAFIVSQQQNDPNIGSSFAQYFKAGQISLPILSASGIIFVALLRSHGKLNPVLAFLLYAFLVVPIIATAFIIGLNPGFQSDVLMPSVLWLLWLIYCVLHVVWFLVLVLETVLPSAEEVATAQEGRVSEIKAGATGRA